MCGLLGMMGDFVHKDKDILRELFHVSVLRGEDSAGLAGVTKANDVHIAKAVGMPQDLFNSPMYNKAECLYNGQAFIGHVRKATVGGISKYTAHPFEYGDIIGVHNGTLDQNWRQLPVDGDYPSDSSKLYASIAEHGIKNTIEFIKGAYALVWWDKSDQTINFLRNDRRELWYAFSEDCNKMFWASEWRMLNLVLARNGVKLFVDKEGVAFHAIPEDIHLKYKPAKNGQAKSTLVSRTELKGGLSDPFLKPKWSSSTMSTENSTTMVSSIYGTRGGTTGGQTVHISRGTGVSSNQSSSGGEVVHPFQAERETSKAEPLQGLPGAIQPISQQKGVVVRKSDKDLNDPLPDTLRKAEERTTTNGTSTSGSATSRATGQHRKTTLTLVQGNKESGSRKSKGQSIVKLGLPNEPEHWVIGRSGVLLNEAMFHHATGDGCVWCGDNDLNFIEEAKYSAGEEQATTKIGKWMSTGGFVCTGCLHQVATQVSC